MSYDRKKAYTYEGLTFHENGALMFGEPDCKECNAFGWVGAQSEDNLGFFFYWCEECSTPENDQEEERFKERMCIVAAFLTGNPEDGEPEDIPIDQLN